MRRTQEAARLENKQLWRSCLELFGKGSLWRRLTPYALATSLRDETLGTQTQGTQAEAGGLYAGEQSGLHSETLSKSKTLATTEAQMCVYRLQQTLVNFTS